MIFYADMPVMLSAWPITRWPWTFIIHRVSRGHQSLYEISAKSNNPRLSYYSVFKRERLKVESHLVIKPK